MIYDVIFRMKCVSRAVSEVQGWQVCDGDVARGLQIPLCLPMPRAFTCVTTKAHNFAIGGLKLTYLVSVRIIATKIISKAINT